MINKQCAKKFCYEDPSLIENYDLAIVDITQTWICHHILGEQYSRQYLIENGLYLNRPASELRFVTKHEHNDLHLKGVPRSEATKQAISDAQKGVPKGPMSEAHKKAISYAMTGVPKPWKYKKVLQFTKSGEFVREWPSMTAIWQELGIRQGNISACCQDNRKSAGGFIWKFKQKDINL